MIHTNSKIISASQDLKSLATPVRLSNRLLNEEKLNLCILLALCERIPSQSNSNV